MAARSMASMSMLASASNITLPIAQLPLIFTNPREVFERVRPSEALDMSLDGRVVSTLHLGN